MVARQFPLYGNTVFIVFAVRFAAVFVFTTSNIGRSARVLPTWFGYAGFAVGAFMLLSVSLTPLLLLVFPAWLIALSTILLIKARSIPREVRLPPGSRADVRPFLDPRESDDDPHGGA